jgi:hypothetical protein
VVPSCHFSQDKVLIMKRLAFGRISAAALLLSLLPAILRGQATYDTPGPIPAIDVASAEILQGPSYKVIDQAYADGMLCSFSLWTPHGWYRPESAAMLNVRIREARAMAALDAMRDDPLFLEGLTDQAGDTIRATGNAIKQPLKTLRGIPLGLEKIGVGIQSRADQGPVAGENGRISYSKAKRALAVDLGVDPYTSNEQLQQMLNTVAASRNAGALTGRIAGAMVGGGTGSFISVAQMNKNLQSRLRDQTAPELQRENAEALRTMGCEQNAISTFLQGKGYTATDCTAITDSLGKRQGVDGRSSYLTFFGPATAPEVPLYYRMQSAMAAGFHLKQQPLSKLDVDTGTAVWTDKGGNKHVFAPIDYLMWTPLAEQRLSNITGEGKVDLWITGTATPLAQEHLAKGNIVLHEKSAELLFLNPQH